MFPSPILALQALARIPDPRLTAADLADWGPGVVENLRAAGFLIERGPAMEAVCTSCGQMHRFDRLPGRPAYAAAPCPDAGIVTRPIAQLQDWTIDSAAVAAWLGLRIGATTPPEEVLPGQAWRWDRVHCAGARRALIIVRSPPAPAAAQQWQRLGLVPKAMLLSLGSKPQVPEDHGPVAFVATVWPYLDDDDGLQFDVGALTAAVGATDDDRREPSRPAVPRRATRNQATEGIHRELVQHIRAAQQALRQQLPLLPVPEQQDIAQRLGMTTTRINRAINAESVDGAKLRRLFDIAANEDLVRSFDANTTQ